MRKKPVKLPGEYYFTRELIPVALKRVRGKDVSHPHDYTGIPHWHDFSELVIITSGFGRQVINDVAYPVSAGDVFVITGRNTHFFEDYQNLSIANIMFSNRVFQGIQEYLNRIPGYHMIFRFEPELRTAKKFRNTLHLSAQSLAYVSGVIRKMEAEFKRNDPGCAAAVLTCLHDLIIFLSRSPESRKENHPITRLAGLFSALEASFQEDWPLERMAKYTGMSVNTLLRNFQAAVKQTPLSYLTSIRLNAAGNLLVNTDLPVSEIAFSCGFHDSNYFGMRFLKMFKMTPLEFRRQKYKIRTNGQSSGSRRTKHAEQKDEDSAKAK